MRTIQRSRRTARGKWSGDATVSDPMQTTSSPSTDANSSDFDTSEASRFDKEVRLRVKGLPERSDSVRQRSPGSDGSPSGWIPF